jgi:hypothetical protein
MLQNVKLQTIQSATQVVPCRAGILAGVVYANGDVSVCENHPPLGNLRQKSFKEIWNSEDARRLRKSIAEKECWCTSEMFLWQSMVFQPAHLVKAMFAAKVWEQPTSMQVGERADYLQLMPEGTEESGVQILAEEKP